LSDVVSTENGTGGTGDEDGALSRRQLGKVIAGAGTLGVAVPLLAACGSSSSGAASDPGSGVGSASAGAGGSTSAGSAGSSDSAGSAGSSGSSGGSAQGVVATSQIPVGGGVILKSANLVATQPTKGTYKLFNATCTHQGCQVASIANGMIDCPCHGSEFSITDGSVHGGPAPSPLPAVAFKVVKGEIVPQG
jgi:Rieske Fe-S protein